VPRGGSPSQTTPRSALARDAAERDVQPRLTPTCRSSRRGVNVDNRRRRFLLDAGRMATGLAGSVVLAGPLAQAALAAAERPSMLAVGPARGREAWLGRGCSATAGALAHLGLEMPRGTSIDFARGTALVIGGVDPASVRSDIPGRAIRAATGDRGGLFVMPASARQLAGSFTVLIGDSRSEVDVAA